MKFSIEAEFSLKSFESQIKGLNQEETTKVAISIYKQLLMERALYQQMLKNNWGIGGGLNEQQH